ncbi:MAG TPA: hypothetical protein VGR51_09330 [Thermoplasmata archaeon]|nr:hypothetical protein [Thermoplasmata archaeon]
MTTLLTALSWALFYRLGTQPFAGVDSDIRRSLYVTAAGIAGSLLGFVLVAVTIMITLPSTPSLEKLRSSRHYPEVFQIFGSTIRYLALTTGVSLLLVVIDFEGALWPIAGYLLIWLALISGARFARCVWVLDRILAIFLRRES